MSFHRLDPEVGKRVLAKNNYHCSKCGSDKDVCVHHKVPTAVDEPNYNDEQGLTTLCRSCHMSHHRASGDISTKGYGRRGSLEVIYCTEKDCGRPQHANGLCKKHYTRIHRHKWKHG